MNELERYLKSTTYENDKYNAERVYRLISKFVKDYPKDKIKEMKFSDFVLVTKEKNKSFCSRLYNEMNLLSSRGNSRVRTSFGIYIDKSDNVIVNCNLSDYNDDYMEFFEFIKQEIIKLLEAGEQDDYDAIINIKLYHFLKYKLLMIYYPDKYIPVTNQKMIDDYFVKFQLPNDPDEDFLYKNLKLKKWKDSVPEMSEWNNFILMNFYEWLRRENKLFDGQAADASKYYEKAEQIVKEIDNLNLTGKSKEAVVKVRINQGVFRDRLKTRYNGCCLCGLKNIDLLTASHIKPWSESDPTEKIDVNNGFLMCPHHDKLFDQGWISFDDNGKIIISNRLSEHDRMLMNVNPSMKIKLFEGNKKYLEYHRENIFK